MNFGAIEIIKEGAFRGKLVKMIKMLIVNLMILQSRAFLLLIR